MGPSADGDPMGTPAADEKVLWQGRPNLSVLARTAFHTRMVAIYFAGLIAVSLAFGNTNAAIVCAVLGVAALAILQGLAWLSARSTLYILTDTRLIMRIGMAIETRINIPLKHVGAAHLKNRGKGHGDIALELNGERMLGNLLLWPHARPWKFTKPQPMLRAVPDAAEVAQTLSDACAKFSAIERNLTEIKEDRAGNGQQVNGPAARADKGALPDRGLEGAPA
ncbi:PH domain-containing protein [Erythrobacter sp. KMU-140]|uniref:PH domain-containing protein n=2 Tax=Erythrobacter rubeus TaxID=2760803 RepID=A0ABR8KSJ5_9SPHN|nr:PH domain-containing protein [Erythrobacter rubeus]